MYIDHLNEIAVVNITSGKIINKIDIGHTQIIRSIQLSGCKKYLLTSSDDNTTKLIDIKSGIVIRTIFDNHDDLKFVNNSLFGNNLEIFTVSTEFIKRWNVNCDCEGIIEENEIRNIIFKHSKNILFTTNFIDDDTIHCWDVNSCKKIAELGKKGKKSSSIYNVVESICFIDKYLASSHYNKKIRIWDIENFTCLKTINTGNEYLCSISGASDGIHIISVALISIQIWDIVSEKCINVIYIESDKDQLVNQIIINTSGIINLSFKDVINNNQFYKLFSLSPTFPHFIAESNLVEIKSLEKKKLKLYSDASICDFQNNNLHNLFTKINSTSILNKYLMYNNKWCIEIRNLKTRTRHDAPIQLESESETIANNWIENMFAVQLNLSRDKPNNNNNNYLILASRFEIFQYFLLFSDFFSGNLIKIISSFMF